MTPLAYFPHPHPSVQPTETCCRLQKSGPGQKIGPVICIFFYARRGEPDMAKGAIEMTINAEVIIILMLIAFIVGMVLGVSLARPNFTR